MPYGYHWSPCPGSGRDSGGGVAAVVVLVIIALAAAAAPAAISAAAGVLEAVFIAAGCVIGLGAVASVAFGVYRVRCYVLDRRTERAALSARQVPWMAQSRRSLRAVPVRRSPAISAPRPRVIGGTVIDKTPGRGAVPPPPPARATLTDQEER